VLDNVQLTGNLTLLDSEDKSTGDDLAKTPDHTGNIGLDWKASDVVSANLAWQYVGSQVIKVPARNAQAFTSKHYQTLDEHQVTVTPALDFKLGITNLTNTSVTRWRPTPTSSWKVAPSTQGSITSCNPSCMREPRSRPAFLPPNSRSC
jgi:outer membrane receptor for ferrienterochelin and colicin